MNYIKEINAFYGLQEQTPLSGSAVTLWFALMHMNNKTRWKNTFTSPAAILRVKSGLSESSFKRARKELIECGYIEVESRTGGRSPMYTMRSLVVEVEEEGLANEGVMEREPVDLSEYNADRPGSDTCERTLNEGVSGQEARGVDRDVTHGPTHHPNQDPAPLYKHKQDINKTKENEKRIETAAAVGHAGGLSDGEKAGEERSPDAIVFYQENFGLVSPFVFESLQDWIVTLGEELVVEAMKRALERNKTTWSYVKSILNAWDKKGIRTVQDAEAEQVAFLNERKRRLGIDARAGSSVPDIVPEWYEEERTKRVKQEQNPTPKAITDKVEKLMKEYLES